MQQIILDAIKARVSKPLHMVRDINGRANNTGSIGLVKFGEILPEHWVTYNFQTEYVHFYDGSKQIANIHYFKDSNDDAIAAVQTVATYLLNKQS